MEGCLGLIEPLTKPENSENGLANDAILKYSWPMIYGKASSKRYAF